jgi:hypothetical protein
MIDEGDCGAIGGMKIGRGNRSTRRKPAPAPLCPPQIPLIQAVKFSFCFIALDRFAHRDNVRKYIYRQHDTKPSENVKSNHLQKLPRVKS